MVNLMSMGSTALNLVIMIISIVVIAGLMALMLFLYFRWKRYKEFECIVFKRDGFGQLVETHDSAGIFVDSKTKNKRFFMKQNNVGLNPDNIPYIPTGRTKKVYLTQNGLKNFRFIKMNIANPCVDIQVGEEDVNWAINAYERQKKLFSSSLWIQLLPFIALAFVSIIILIIFIYFFREFSTLKDFAVVMKEAMQYAAQARAGTTVI